MHSENHWLRSDTNEVYVCMLEKTIERTLSTTNSGKCPGLYGRLDFFIAQDNNIIAIAMLPIMLVINVAVIGSIIMNNKYICLRILEILAF